jgi:hypothetical protein
VDPETTSPSAQPPVTPPAASPPGATDDADVAGDARTVEEVEAAWRQRQGKQERAHAAAEQVLRDQIAVYERRLTGADRNIGQQAGSEATSEELAEARRQLEVEKAARIASERRAKYPALAATVGGDNSIFSNTDEATLAKLNASYEDVRAPVMAPTSPRRSTPTTPKRYSEKSKEELLDDLRQVSPAYTEWQRQQR